MTFAEPQRLWLLAVAPWCVLGLLWWGARTRRRLRTRFVPPRLLELLMAGWSPARERGRMILLTAASAFLVLAWARPQWGYTWEEVRRRGLDIVVAVDVSRSMLASDVQPNRLGRAKLAVRDLARVARSDRLALVAFAGSAVLLCPLTWDESVFLQTLDALEVGTVSDTGTSLAAGLEAALRAFQPDVDNYRVVVLLTDGEDHEGGAVEAARRAASQGVRLFAIGVGTVEGDLLRVRGPQGREEYVRDEGGQVVKSRLNEGLLQEMAAATPGGFYLPLQGARVVETLYERGLADLPRGEGTERFMRQLREQYHWPLALALLCLGVEWLWPERKRRLQARPGAVLGVWVGLWVGAGGSLDGLASPVRALREYEAGRYESALRDFQALLEKRPEDERLQFNAGTAHYRMGHYDEAAALFEQATRSQDLKLQEWAYYNRGNSLYRLGEQAADPVRQRQLWEEALRQYLHALRLNTNNADAQYNLEFVRRRLEELPPPPPQPQAGGGQPGTRPAQDQSQGEAGDSPATDEFNPDSSPAGSGDSSVARDQRSETPHQGHEGPSTAWAETPSADSAQPEGLEPSDRAARSGRMTPEEAQQLLDSLRGDEKRFPMEREARSRTGMRTRKDW